MNRGLNASELRYRAQFWLARARDQAQGAIERLRVLRIPVGVRLQPKLELCHYKFGLQRRTSDFYAPGPSSQGAAVGTDVSAVVEPKEYLFKVPVRIFVKQHRGHGHTQILIQGAGDR